MKPVLSDMIFRFSPETLPETLLILGKGMLGVFIAMIFVGALIILMGKLSERKGR